MILTQSLISEGRPTWIKRPDLKGGGGLLMEKMMNTMKMKRMNALRMFVNLLDGDDDLEYKTPKHHGWGHEATASV